MNRMNTVFRSISVLVLSSAVLAFSACSSGESDRPATSRTIRFWHFWSEPGQKAALQEVVKAFEAENKCTVELTELSWNDGKAKLQAAFNSGQAPDVVELGSDWVAQFSSSGVLMQLPGDSAGVGGFVPYSIAPGIWNNRCFAYPWTLDTRVMFANEGLLKQAGWTKDIQTLDDLLAAARAVQERGQYGFGANGADANRLYKKILPFMWTLGGDVFDATGRPVLNSPQNVRAFTLYADLARTGFVETQRQIDASFVQGKVALWPSGSWIIKKLKANPSLRYRLLAMPGTSEGGQVVPGISFAGGEYLAVSAKTGNTQLSRDFVRYMTNGANAIKFCAKVTEAGFPADKAFFRDPSLTADADKAAFARQLEHARMTPVHPRWLDIQAVIEDAVVEVLYGNATPQQALDAAQQNVLQIVGQ